MRRISKTWRHFATYSAQPGEEADLSDALLVIPRSASKAGAQISSLPPASVAEHRVHILQGRVVGREAAATTARGEHA